MNTNRSWMKFVVFALVLLTTVVGLAGCSAQKAAPAKELATVRYGGQYYADEFLLYGDPKIWEDNGIKVQHTLFSSATESNQALISGSIDINIGSDSKTVSLFNAIPGKPLIIACAQRGDRYSTFIKTDAPYKTWYDLKGKKVGVRLSTGAEQVVRRYFEKVGDLKWEDFEWVNVKVEDSIAALSGGQIEAYTAWEPTPAIAESQGVAKIIMSYGDIAMTPVIIQTTEEYAKAHHDEIVRFLAAHLEKAALIQKDPKGAAELAAKAANAQGTQVSADAFERVFKRLDFNLVLDQSIIDALKDTGQFLVGTGEIKSVPELKWDASYLEEAKKMVAGK